MLVHNGQEGDRMNRYDMAPAILARHTAPPTSDAPRAEREPVKGATFYLEIPK